MNRECRHGGVRRVSGVICERRISARVKWKAYKMIVRPAVIGEDATDKKAGG